MAVFRDLDHSLNARWLRQNCQCHHCIALIPKGVEIIRPSGWKQKRSDETISQCRSRLMLSSHINRHRLTILSHRRRRGRPPVAVHTRDRRSVRTRMFAQMEDLIQPRISLIAEPSPTSIGYRSTKAQQGPAEGFHWISLEALGS